MANLGSGIANGTWSAGGRRRRPAKARKSPLRSVLSAALLFGTAQHAAYAHGHDAHGAIEAELRAGHTAKAVERGEAAVAKAPQDAQLRAELGHAYLRAGRFEAAAAALGNALALGDTTDRITLSLALAQIACGQNRAALATLDHGADIAPGDLGLALALAGDAGRGIAILTNAVREGSASPALRQNLAYAYALDGRWADATLTAGFDLPPDQVNARMEQWAQSMQAGGERLRVARLLNVPLTNDPGMPATLALNVGKAEPQPIAAVPALVPEPAVAIVTPAPKPAAVAVADPAPAAAAMTFIATPVVQPIAAAPAPAAFHDIAVQAHGARPASAHFVQLAAYHDQRSAERGKVILAKRHPLLRGHGLLITEARLHGRNYWRVVIAGFDGATAANLCTSLKRQGAACFAYSVKAGRPGAALAVR